MGEAVYFVSSVQGSVFFSGKFSPYSWNRTAYAKWVGKTESS